ncbi:MAG: AgmX/PglI C-terminal domain-containing protein [Sandaracinaceae bacterium]
MRLKPVSWRSWTVALATLALLVGGVGCGGSEETESTDTQHSQRESTSGSETSREASGGPQITGLMGTIRSDQVENTMNPRVDRMARCFANRMGTIEVLGGSIRLGFRIHTDGTVAWVYPIETDIGDQQTEQCILDQASRARFPRPRGGEAEFTWGFGLEPSPDVRPPLNWGADALGSHADDLRGLARQCHASGTFNVTAYVQPGGDVLAAGGAAPDAEQLEALGCLLDGVRGWTFRDPGSYAAKISFQVR